MFEVGILDLLCTYLELFYHNGHSIYNVGKWRLTRRVYVLEYAREEYVVFPLHTRPHTGRHNFIR